MQALPVDVIWTMLCLIVFSMKRVITCFVLFFVLLLFFFFFLFGLFSVCFFYGVILPFSLGWKTCNQFYHYNIGGRGKIWFEIWSLKHIRDFRLWIWLWGSFVLYVVLLLTRDIAFLFNSTYLRVVANVF